MTPPRRFDIEGSRASGGACDDLDLACLKNSEGTPDMTRRIMGRLGYMRASARAVARTRRRRLAHRAAVTLFVLICGWIGMKFYEFGSWTRQPDAVTLPTAISTDLARHEDRLDSAMRTIHRLTAYRERLPLTVQPEAVAVDAADVDEAPELSVKPGGGGAPLWLAPSAVDM